MHKNHAPAGAPTVISRPVSSGRLGPLLIATAGLLLAAAASLEAQTGTLGAPPPSYGAVEPTTQVPYLGADVPAGSAAPPVDAYPSWIVQPDYRGEPPTALPATQSSPGMPVPGHPGTFWNLDFLARGYYLNDQRVEWSGQETTFGAEGVLSPVLRHQFDSGEARVQGEFYLNQPFENAILVDTVERRSYRQDFIVQTFEISQLYVSLQFNDLTFSIGKKETPFGRCYIPLYTNSRLDAPFIRTESILWRETGVFLNWKPGLFVGDVAITNGGPDRDTNSSKALVSRAGLEGENWAVGISFKIQDGISSEDQKRYKNHLGMDFMYRWGIFTLSSEVIYDEYGFRRPVAGSVDAFFAATEMERSIYYRDLNYRMNVPITGLGYYINFGFQGEVWGGQLNYGEFYPSQIGVAQHDIVNRRGIGKLTYAFTPHLKNYNVVMLETAGYMAQDHRSRRGIVVLTGLEYTF